MAVEFGKYQLLRKLGAGGMGQVFLARQPGAEGFEKLVVIKRLLPHLSEDDEFLPMFLDEARIAARLNHPNLIQIFELGEVHGAPFIAMEYVRGEDLRKLDRLARASGALVPLGLTLRICADAAAGLDYAHKVKDSQGRPLKLVHRDVSPQNILVGFDGGVKLIDFGVAKAAGRLQHTGTGILKGKYPYMSPEQAEGTRELDGRSDIFALGVVLWEVLTGKRLFKGESDLATMRLVTDCQVPPPSKVNPAVAPALDAVVLKALAREPAQRYPDAAAFRLAIEDFILQQRLAASSAHLAAYLAELYQDRLAAEDDPATLDQMTDGVDPDSGSKPSASRSSSRDWRKAGSPPARGSREGGAKGVTEAAPREPRGRGLPLGIGLVVALMLLGGVGYVLTTRAPPVAQAAVDAGTPAAVAVAPAPPPPVAEDAAVTTPRVVLMLVTEPAGAQVEIAGQPVGLTPLSYSLPPGAPVVASITLAGYEPQRTELRASDAPELLVKLRKKTPRRPPAGLGIKTDR